MTTRRGLRSGVERVAVSGAWLGLFARKRSFQKRFVYLARESFSLENLFLFLLQPKIHTEGSERSGVNRAFMRLQPHSSNSSEGKRSFGTIVILRVTSNEIGR